MSNFCENCGKEVSNNQDVCLNCGVKLRKHDSNQVYYNTNRSDKAESQATVGFVLGLVSIVAWFIPLFGYPVTICGIVFSAKGMNASLNKGKALTGLILSIVFLVITFFNSFLGVLLAS